MVQSSPFGPVRLSGDDARIFVWQLRYGRPKKAACAAAQRAERMREELHKTVLWSSESDGHEHPYQGVVYRFGLGGPYWRGRTRAGLDEPSRWP